MRKQVAFDNCLEKSGLPVLVSLKQLIAALSAAFDLAARSERQHSLRTAYVGVRTARVLQMQSDEIEDLYFASLLHDLIPPGSPFDQSLIFEILETLPLRASVARLVAQLWGLKYRNHCANICSDQISRNVRIIYLAESFESRYFSSCGDEYDKRRELLTWVNSFYRGPYGQISGALMECMQEEAFWQDLKENRIQDINRFLMPDVQRQLDFNDIEKVSRSFAVLIDRKNLFTGQHSKRVGVIAAQMAALGGFDQGTTRKLKIAGYLHDLGKLAVEEEVLNKTGPLNDQERQAIKAHPYHTYAVLNQIEGFEDIAAWAGNHHERIDGSGYPWGKSDLGLPDQIVAVADIYEALTADRPYRRALPGQEALYLLRKETAAQKIDNTAYELLKDAVQKNIIERNHENKLA